MRMDYTIIKEILVLNLVGQSGVVVRWGLAAFVGVERILLSVLIKWPQRTRTGAFVRYRTAPWPARPRIRVKLMVPSIRKG
jgi:hypothetical protein